MIFSDDFLDHICREILNESNGDKSNDEYSDLYDNDEFNGKLIQPRYFKSLQLIKYLSLPDNTYLEYWSNGLDQEWRVVDSNNNIIINNKFGFPSSETVPEYIGKYIDELVPNWKNLLIDKYSNEIKKLEDLWNNHLSMRDVRVFDKIRTLYENIQYVQRGEFKPGYTYDGKFQNSMIDDLNLNWITEK